MPRNLDDFAAVSRRILQTGPRNLAKFSAENWALVMDDLVGGCKLPNFCALVCLRYDTFRTQSCCCQSLL